MKIDNIKEIIDEHIKITKKKDVKCNFTHTFVAKKDDSILQQGDRCRVNYQFEVQHGEDLIYYRAEWFDSWYLEDRLDKERFGDIVIGELILKGLFKRQ